MFAHTFDETSGREFDLRCYYDFCGVWSIPHQTCSGLDAERITARHVGSPSRRNIGNVGFVVYVLILVDDVTLCLFWTNTAIQRLDIGHLSF